MLTLASAEPAITALRAKGEMFNLQIKIILLDLAYYSVQNVHQCSSLLRHH